MFGDSQWSNLRSALIGAVVAAVVLVTFPAAAAVGSSLILGEGNSADAVTSLSGSATTNLRITNTRTGSPALTLRVEEGAAPLAVNSLRRVRYLNADRLDGKHGAAYALADEQPKAASCSASVIADGRDWACPMTIEVPATGSVLRRVRSTSTTTREAPTSCGAVSTSTTTLSRPQCTTSPSSLMLPGRVLPTSESPQGQEPTRWSSACPGSAPTPQSTRGDPGCCSWPPEQTMRRGQQPPSLGTQSIGSRQEQWPEAPALCPGSAAGRFAGGHELPGRMMGPPAPADSLAAEEREDVVIEQMIGKRTASQLAVAVGTITVALSVIALALVVIAVTAVIGVV